MSPRAPSRAGFSLIELLVVIAIIAVLIAILLPTLPAIRDSGRRAACGSNLRSIGQGIQVYYQQSKDKFPIARYMPAPWLSGSTSPGLPTALASAIEPDSRGYRCPGDKVIAPVTWTDTSGGSPVEREGGMSYTYVTALSGIRYEESFFYKRLAIQPTDAPVAYDFDGGTYETQDGRQITAPFFHSTRNVLFVDGHVGKYTVVPPGAGPGDQPPGGGGGGG